MLGQMFMPIMVDSGSGPSDPMAYLAMLIVLNLVCLGIFTVRSIIWFVKRPKYNFGYPTIKEGPSFWEYTLWSGNDDFIPDFSTLAWGGINALAFIIYGSWLLYHLMGGALPFS